MAGHSKWAQIKRQKGASDIQKSKTFSKLAKVISIAAKKGSDPNTNAELRGAIDKARTENMPMENIKRAIEKGAGGVEGGELESIRYEAYGPGGAAIIIDTITDNSNRTVAEIKHILNENGAKFAERGSVLWVFDLTGAKPTPKMTTEISSNDKEGLDKLIKALLENDDVQEEYTNVK